MRLQQSNQQQQQKRSFNPHISKLLITQLDNSAAVERFRKFDIKYFDFTCSELYDKDDYVTISDKIYYCDV